MGVYSRSIGLVALVLLGAFLFGCETASPQEQDSPEQVARKVATLEVKATTIAETKVAAQGPTASIPVATPSLVSSTTAEPAPTIAATPLPGPLVTIGDAQFAVEVADTASERSQGLSGRPSLAPGTGMLFVFDKPGGYSFWMIDMQFPLDFVWIGADCTVVDLMEDIPPPQPSQSPDELPRYQPVASVQYVLEINGGDIASKSISIGDAVAFEGVLAGRYGC